MFEPNPNYERHDGIIPHLKVLIIANDRFDVNDDTVIYFGSHNFTASAWGKYEKEETVLQISNTELGVLFAPKLGSAAMKQKIIEGLPFKYPPRKFAKDESPFFNNFHKSD